MLSTHRKSQLIGLTEQLSGLGLKAGISLVIIAAGYLLTAVFGHSFREMGTMSPQDREYLVRGVGTAVLVLRYAGFAVVVSLVIRLFDDEVLGQSLAVAGAVLYFGSPLLFGSSPVSETLRRGELYGSIVQAFQTVGAACLWPGLFFVLRDAILRIWRGVSVRRVVERRWGDEEERQKKLKKPKFYGNCWDMAFCREFVRNVCPAFLSKKPCWRIKRGCYCDEETILKAMMTYGANNDHARGIMRSLGVDQQRSSRLSNALKRQRCRRCGIYAEHQRQKYRLLSPMVFPAVGLVFYLFYGNITAWVSTVLVRTDRFMSFLTYRGSGAQSFESDVGVLTAFAVVWLAVIAVSYVLRALEYLVFDLQV